MSHLLKSTKPQASSVGAPSAIDAAGCARPVACKHGNQYFTVVYKNVAPGDEARVLFEHPKAVAGMWGHALHERDKALNSAKRQSEQAAPDWCLTKEQRQAVAICFGSGRVSVSEVQRKMGISYRAAQEICQSIVDSGMARGLEIAPMLDKSGAPEGLAVCANTSGAPL